MTQPVESQATKKIHEIEDSITALVIADMRLKSVEEELAHAQRARRDADEALAKLLWSVDEQHILHYNGSTPIVVTINGEPSGGGKDCFIQPLETPAQAAIFATDPQEPTTDQIIASAMLERGEI